MTVLAALKRLFHINTTPVLPEKAYVPVPDVKERSLSQDVSGALSKTSAAYFKAFVEQDPKDAFKPYMTRDPHPVDVVEYAKMSRTKSWDHPELSLGERLIGVPSRENVRTFHVIQKAFTQNTDAAGRILLDNARTLVFNELGSPGTDILDKISKHYGTTVRHPAGQKWVEQRVREAYKFLGGDAGDWQYRYVTKNVPVDLYTETFTPAAILDGVQSSKVMNALAALLDAPQSNAAMPA